MIWTLDLTDSKRIWFNYIGVVATLPLLSNAVPLPHDAEAFGCSLSGLTHCAYSLDNRDTPPYDRVPLSTQCLTRTSPQHSEQCHKCSTPQASPHSSLRSDHRHALNARLEERKKRLVLYIKSSERAWHITATERPKIKKLTHPVTLTITAKKSD